MANGILLGAHESVGGGLSKSIARAEAHGAQALQIFTKNARGWKAKPLEGDEVQAFRAEVARAKLPALSHASYLINLGAEDPELRAKGLDAMEDELARCDALGVPALVVHPGTHPDRDLGIALVIEALREVHARRPKSPTRILLENTAGQGSSLGCRFEDLGDVFTALGTPGWLGVCLDTCHLFAAGFDISTAAGYAETLARFDEQVGLSLVRAFHLNDCKGPLGCRVDRHEDIGQGKLGKKAFECLVNDPRFRGLPAVLETEEGSQEKNLAALRALLH
ncbi:MAG: deoxyribonuclease IV [Deltaproteobacteria bacterium]